MWLVLAIGFPTSVSATDKTPPTTPVVTDAGAYTTSTTQLHASWTSSDPESGIAEYQYQIRRDATTGTVIVGWTSTGTTSSVTKTGLSLASGKSYFFSVKAKNGAGLWSAVGYSDGIKVDTTAPSTPVVTDDGAYTASPTQLHASWTSSDVQSGLAEYQYQIRRDSTTGTVIVGWTSTGTTTAVTKTGLSLSSGKTYFFGVKAKNGAGLWSAVGYSDGIKVDGTAPSAPGQPTEGSPDADTDADGNYTVYWPAASDAESGISAYELQEKVGTTGRWNSLSTSITGTSFAVSGRLNNTQYFYRARAKNGAGTLGAWSLTSDGVLVQLDTTPPTGTIQLNGGAPYTNQLTITLTLSATDNSGTVSQMQCSNDGLAYSSPEPYATSKPWALAAGDGPKTVYVKYSDPSNNWSSPVSASITLDTTMPVLAITWPTDGAVLGGQ